LQAAALLTLFLRATCANGRPLSASNDAALTRVSLQEQLPKKKTLGGQRQLVWPPVPPEVAARNRLLKRKMPLERTTASLTSGKGGAGLYGVCKITANNGEEFYIVRIAGKCYQKEYGKFAYTDDGARECGKAADRCLVGKLKRAPMNFDLLGKPLLAGRSGTGLVGVCFEKSKGKYEAYLMLGSKKRRIGTFDEEDDAAKAHDEKALDYGELTNYVYE
jgi:hypothetical protein